ncbi:hypothetical protein [Mucilaginibacter sp.]|uniref:hypothetical protein n=1 Tax=Mucilaginibacter sp. TaxID=1882438 RepID=UPI00262EDC21|nr:hypothetical protein [Mucilaginibacter sp.]MDB5128026.1 hypothetical protein [Mucilaginibacter sp.]
MKRLTLLFTVALLFAAIPGFCIQKDTTAKPLAKPVVAPAPPVSANVPHVTKVFAKQMTIDSTKGIAFSNDIILVKLIFPKEFIQTRPTDKSRLMLYANGIELKGISSDLFSKITKEQFVTTDTVVWIPFKLKRDTSTKAAWDYLYRLTDKWNSNKINVHITVGWEGMFPVKVYPTDYERTAIAITYYNIVVFWLMTLAYAGLLLLLGRLVIKSDILKEGPNGAYSLAQTQLAFWTVLIIAGFIYSLVLTDIPSTLNTSILELLGISVLTNGSASYIDYFKKQKKGTYTPKKSRSFLWDILSDGTSLNMQRFQIFAWNIVLGTYFLVYTFNNKSMPTFPDVLLLLAGMSSLTYVSAKPTEPK